MGVRPGALERAEWTWVWSHPLVFTRLFVRAEGTGYRGRVAEGGVRETQEHTGRLPRGKRVPS